MSANGSPGEGKTDAAVAGWRMKYDRRTLIINVCGLALAFVLATEDIYINYRIIGWAPAGSYWPAFIPAAVMFLAGRRYISYCLFVMYALTALYIGYGALMIHFDAIPRDRHVLKGMSFYEGIILIVSMVCYAVYIIVGTTRWLFRLLKASPKTKG